MTTGVLKLSVMKTKHLPWKTFTVLGCAAIQFSLSPSCSWSLMFLMESTSFLEPAWRFTIKWFFPLYMLLFFRSRWEPVCRLYFNKQRQRLACVLGFTEHKHVLSLSIINYSNHCTLNNPKILHTPNCSELSVVEMLLWSCCSFSRKTRAPVTDDLMVTK